MLTERGSEKLNHQDRVVMFLVYNSSNNKYTIEERTREDSAYRGSFMIPAGHVNENEDKEDALKRELWEEQGIVPTEIHHLDTFKNVSMHGNMFVIDAYLIKTYQGEIVNKEPNKCVLHQMGFDEAIQKMEHVHNKYVLLKAEVLLRQYS